MAKLNITKKEVSQEIDLNNLIKADISEDEQLVLKIGQKIIDYIEDRVDEGLGYSRKKLEPEYSDEYADSLQFKAAGKSKTDVNMKLTGDMMASIDIIEVNGSKITIGIDDPDQAPKAFNHQTGDTVPKRPFFGVTHKELKEFVLSEFKDEIKAKRTTSAEEQSRLISAIRGIRTLAEFLGD